MVIQRRPFDILSKRGEVGGGRGGGMGVGCLIL